MMLFTGLLDCPGGIYVWNTFGIWRLGVTGWVFFPYYSSVVRLYGSCAEVASCYYPAVLCFAFCSFNRVFCVLLVFTRSIYYQIIFTHAVPLGFACLVFRLAISSDTVGV